MTAITVLNGRVDVVDSGILISENRADKGEKE
jgi:hypothetical protein